MTTIALTIAGSDPSGGAGIQADLKTFAALGIYGASVVTALTAQNTRGVTAIHDVPPSFVTAEIDSVFDDLAIAAVKIGMLSQPGVIEAVADGLDRYRARNVVLDPVMVATSGDALISASAVTCLRDVLLPRAAVLTPNLPEAAVLLGCSVAEDEHEMERQARRLLALGPAAILLKGGHSGGPESVDLLVDADVTLRLPAPRQPTRNTHGTGCTLSAALAAGLARGSSLADAARDAKTYVTEAIRAADDLSVGTGAGPLHHFHRWW